MTMRVTILSTVMGESGSLLTAGSTYTVGREFGEALVGGNRATDTDGVLTPPQTEMKPYFATDTSGNITGLAGPGGVTILAPQYLDRSDKTGYGYKSITRSGDVLCDVIDTAGLTLATWTGDTGTLEVSREITYDGRPTLKITMPSACTRVEIGVTSGVASLYTSGHLDTVGVGMYIPSLTGLGVTQIYLGDASYTVEQHATFDLSVTGLVGWQHLRWDNRAAAINEGTSTTPGVINSGNVAQCKIRINKSAGAASTVYITSIAELPIHKAKIVFTADDGFDEWYTWLKDQAILYNIPWAMGIDGGYLGTAGFMTAAQVSEMSSTRPDLFQFYSHGKLNQGYSDVGAAAYAANVAETAVTLSALGVKTPTLYHPYVKGQRGDDLDALMVDLGVKVARLANGVVGETYKPTVMDRSYGSNPKIKMRMGLSLEASNSLATAKTAVDNAIAAGGVLMIMAHEFVSSGASALQWTYADTIALMAYVQKKSNAGLCDVIDVKTLANIV